MAFLIVEKGPANDLGKTFVVENSLVIGRSVGTSQPEVALNDPYVSRRHAEIVFDQGRYSLRDLGSTNGTLLDDARVEHGTLYRLEHDSLIGIGVSEGSPRVALRFKETSTLVFQGTKDQQTQGHGLNWLAIDRDRQEIRIDGKLAEMSRKEYDLLSYLEANSGRLCRKDEIIANVWPEALNPGAVSDAALDQLVHRLRTKTEPDPRQPLRLISRKGFGYMLVNP